MKNLRQRIQILAIVLFFGGGGYFGLDATPEPWMNDWSLPEVQVSDRKHGKARVRLEHADMLSYDVRLNKDIQRLVGNVKFRHENATMTCDSAYLNEQTQVFEAYGNVHMIQADTIHIYAKYLHYDGLTRLARLRRDVRLENSTTQVFTDSLDYDRIQDLAYYFDGGTVVDAQNTLTSDYGQFAPRTNDAEFRYNVHLINDSTEMRTEQFFYNTVQRAGHYSGATEIRSDSGLIVSSRGMYDLNKNEGILLDRSEVFSGARRLLGDSIYYDGAKRFGEAFGQMELYDTAQRASLFGDYGYFDSQRNYAFATSRSYAVDYSQADTIYVGADTLELISFVRDVRDTAIRIPSDTLQRQLRAYSNVKVFRHDAQAVADSLSYVSTDSVLSLFGRPIMWNESRQLTGDTAVTYFRNDQLHYIDVIGSAFGVEQMIDDSTLFNQIKSGLLRAYMQDSVVRQIDALRGPVESVFYMKEEGKSIYSGMNRMSSSAMHVTLDSGQIKKILWLGETKAKVYPMSMAQQDGANRLEGFLWADARRPRSPQDVIPLDTTLTDYTPIGLRRYSGYQAAQAVYVPYEKAREEYRIKLDSIEQQRRDQVDTHNYQYILRSSSLPYVMKSGYQILNDNQWLYNPFSDPGVPDPLRINTSTGILDRMHWRNVSNESVESSLKQVK